MLHEKSQRENSLIAEGLDSTAGGLNLEINGLSLSFNPDEAAVMFLWLPSFGVS